MPFISLVKISFQPCLWTNLPHVRGPSPHEFRRFFTSTTYSLFLLGFNRSVSSIVLFLSCSKVSGQCEKSREVNETRLQKCTLHILECRCVKGLLNRVFNVKLWVLFLRKASVFQTDEILRYEYKQIFFHLKK